MLTIFSKELKSYFHSAVGYIFMTVFLLISGLFFALYNLVQGSGYYNDVIFNMTFIFLFLVPILTMKMLSNESREKTDQLLLTSPLKVWEIVMGKFLAAVALFVITVCITFIYPIILSKFGQIALGEAIGGYIGFILMGACFISVGLFISSLTDNLVTAGVGTFGALFLIWIIDSVKSGFPTSINSGVIFAGVLVILICFFIYNSMKNIYLSFGIGIIGIISVIAVYLINKSLYEGLIVKFSGWFSILQRFEPFNIGMLSVSSIVYYITFTSALLYLTICTLDKRRWN